jgi:4-oxalocrotonate tautomerase
MPHVTVKLLPGRSKQQKVELARQIAKDVVRIANADEKSVSIAIEEVAAADWADKVYKPDIAGHWDKLYKKPRYNPPLKTGNDATAYDCVRRLVGLRSCSRRSWSVAGSAPYDRLTSTQVLIPWRL